MNAIKKSPKADTNPNENILDLLQMKVYKLYMSAYVKCDLRVLLLRD